MRFRSSALVATLLLASAPLLAGELTATPPQHPKRWLANCMWKRMSANHALSYNDASRACKDELSGSKADAALSTDAARKPVG